MVNQIILSCSVVADVLEHLVYCFCWTGAFKVQVWGKLENKLDSRHTKILSRTDSHLWCICMFYETHDVKSSFGSNNVNIFKSVRCCNDFGRRSACMDNIAEFFTDVPCSSLLSCSFILSSQSVFGAEAESPTDHSQRDFPGR